MEQQLKSENTEIITDKRLKNLKPAWKKGESGNLKGHPKGQKNYATLRREAIIELGKLNNKTPEEIEVMLHSKGLSEALKGNYQFYKDDLDRLHGTAQNNLHVDGDLNIAHVISIDE